MAGSAASVENLSLREKKRRILNQIGQIRAKLKEASKEPVDQTIVKNKPDVCSTGSLQIWCIRQMTRRDVLEEDLLRLLQELQVINREIKEYKHKCARRTSRRFHETIHDVITDAEKNFMLNEGDYEIPEEDYERIDRAAEIAITNDIQLVTEYPTEKNMGALLGDLTNSYFWGTDNRKEELMKRAWDTLERAGTRNAKQAENDFRNNPSVGNFRRYLKKAANAMRMGGEINLLQLSPRRRKFESTYEVQKGDSLPEISRKFYGHPGYWDLIYFQNFSALGVDILHPRVGVWLTIP